MNGFRVMNSGLHPALVQILLKFISTSLLDANNVKMIDVRDPV